MIMAVLVRSMFNKTGTLCRRRTKLVFAACLARRDSASRALILCQVFRRSVGPQKACQTAFPAAVAAPQEHMVSHKYAIVAHGSTVSQRLGTLWHQTCQGFNCQRLVDGPYRTSFLRCAQASAFDTRRFGTSRGTRCNARAPEFLFGSAPWRRGDARDEIGPRR